MVDVLELKSRLLLTEVFIDNQYFSDYVNLIIENLSRLKEKGKTQSHHIMPVSYFKDRNINVDNSSDNRVNLLYKDHIYAHYLLTLCSKDKRFTYNNMVSMYKILGSTKPLHIDDESLDLIQKSYEINRDISYENNPMFIEELRSKHCSIMRSDAVRNKISISMKKYRSYVPFSDEHRRKLSESAMGNHNFGTGDTRSLGCYCVLDTGEEFHFHSMKDGGIWWFNTLHPFGDNYSQPTFQRKIKASAEGKPIIFLDRAINKRIIITNIHWYFEGGDA